jgi:hypothetical protein
MVGIARPTILTPSVIEELGRAVEEGARTRAIAECAASGAEAAHERCPPDDLKADSPET